jgi:hypothetical protein
VFILDDYNIKMDAMTETLKGILRLKLEDGNAEELEDSVLEYPQNTDYS